VQLTCAGTPVEAGEIDRTVNIEHLRLEDAVDTEWVEQLEEMVEETSDVVDDPDVEVDLRVLQEDEGTVKIRKRIVIPVEPLTDPPQLNGALKTKYGRHVNGNIILTFCTLDIAAGRYKEQRIPIKWKKAHDLFNLAAKYSRDALSERARNELYPPVPDKAPASGIAEEGYRIQESELAKVYAFMVLFSN
jgi:hypothetical protein